MTSVQRGSGYKSCLLVLPVQATVIMQTSYSQVLCVAHSKGLKQHVACFGWKISHSNNNNNVSIRMIYTYTENRYIA